MGRPKGSKNKPKLPPQTVVSAPCAMTPPADTVAAAPAKPVEKSEWAKNVEAIRATIRAKLEAQRQQFLAAPKQTPPFDPAKLLDTSVVEGKTLAQWDAEDTRLSAAHIQKRQLVYEPGFPGWVSYALDKWRKNGRPTRAQEIGQEYEKLLAKAKRQEKAAADDEDASKLFPKNSKKAQKKLESAKAKKEKALALYEEAEAFKQRWEAGEIE